MASLWYEFEYVAVDVPVGRISSSKFDNSLVRTSLAKSRWQCGHGKVFVLLPDCLRRAFDGGESIPKLIARALLEYSKRGERQ